MAEDPHARRLLRPLEPIRHLALLLGLSTTDWRTVEDVCRAAPKVRSHATGDTYGKPPSGPFRHYGYHGSSAALRLSAMARKGIVEQRRIEGVQPMCWRLTPLGLRVLDAAREDELLPELEPGWVPASIPWPVP